MRIVPLFYTSEKDRSAQTLFTSNENVLISKGDNLSKANKKHLIDEGYYSVYVQDAILKWNY